LPLLRREAHAWLRDIDGVKSVEATYETGLVNITADENTSVEEMLGAVVAAGFIPGAPQVIGDARGIAAVELPIEASKADLAELEPAVDVKPAIETQMAQAPVPVAPSGVAPARATPAPAAPAPAVPPATAAAPAPW